MKTQNTHLNFSKLSLVELNQKELLEINGGTTGAACEAAVAVIKASSQGCAEAAANAIIDAIQNVTQE